MNDDNSKKLWEALSQDYDMGSYEEFVNDIQDEAKRRKLYDAIIEEYDLPDFDGFSQQLGISKPVAVPQQQVPQAQQQDTVEADGNVFTESQLEAMENGAPVVQKKPTKGFIGSMNERMGKMVKPASSKPAEPTVQTGAQPSPLQPEEYKIPKPFDYSQQKKGYSNASWGEKQKALAEAVQPGSKSTFAERAKAMREAQQADETRRMVRGDYDKENFNDFYANHVEPAFAESKKEAGEEAYKEYKSNTEGFRIPDVMGHGAMQEAFAASVASEKHEDPFRVVNNTLQRINDDPGYTDYILGRMGVNSQEDGEGESRPLSEEEQALFKLLFSNEASELATLISDRLYNTYQQAETPDGVLEYIGGKALHENFASTLMNALIRRAANSSGIREQLRQMAYERYGESKEGFGGWSMRAAGSAAPFAVDVVSGGFALPGMAGKAAAEGVASYASKGIVKEAAKRAGEGAVASEAKRAAKRVAARYLGESPIYNIGIRSASGAANFGTYDLQTELIHEIAEGEFKPFDLVKSAAHGAALGTIMGVTGGTIGYATRNSSFLGKLGGSAAGIGAETTIFGMSSGLQKAMDDDVVTDVDWSDTMGEAFGMVVGMKTVGAAMNPADLAKRYQKSKDYDLRLNEHDLEQLKKVGIDMSSLFKGLGEFGKIMPIEGTITREVGETSQGIDGHWRTRQGTAEEVFVDRDLYEALLSDPEISSSTKRKIVFMATGQVLMPEPVFGARIEGKSVTTMNVRGTDIETKDFKTEEEAKQYYAEMTDAGRASTIKSLEYLSAKNKFGSVVPEAKSRTQADTGVNVDDMEALAELDSEQSDKVLDAYVKNLQEAYMRAYNQNLARLNMTGAERRGQEAPIEESGQIKSDLQEAYDRANSLLSDETMKALQEDPENTLASMQGGDKEMFEAALNYVNALHAYQGMMNKANGADGADGASEANGQVRSERRQASYDRGVQAVQNTGDLATLTYETHLATVRMETLLPDSDPVLGRLRRDIMAAVEADNDAEADRLIEGNAAYLDARQKEAIEQWRDAMQYNTGIQDGVTQQAQAYEQQRREELGRIAAPDGSITFLQTNDGHTYYYISGDLNNQYGAVIVSDKNGQKSQIPVSSITNAGVPLQMEDILKEEVDRYGAELEQNIASLANGSGFIPGSQVDFVIAGTMFRGTVAGSDMAGNYIFQMEDGSQVPLSPQDAQKAVTDANKMKIAAQLKQEKDTAIAQQRKERFAKGIVGYAEGQPDLTAKASDPKAVAEYLESMIEANGANGADGHTETLKMVNRMADNVKSQIEKDSELVRQLTTKSEIEGLTEDEQRAFDEAHVRIDEALQQRRKWGEIRQALMTDEERQKFEAETQKAIKKAMDGANVANEATGQAIAIPTGQELLEKYEEKGDAADYIETLRRNLKAQYRDEVYPQLATVREALDDYMKGLSDLTTDEIKDLVKRQSELDAQVMAMTKQSQELGRLASTIGRLYAGREKQRLTPHEYKMQQLEKETNREKKLKLAKEAFAGDEEALSVLEDTEPQDVYEWVADNLGAGSLNWEGKQVGEHYVRGVSDMVGKDKKRGFGKDSDTKGYNYFLAPEGEGKGYDEVVHAIAEGSPYSTEDVSNALYELLTSASKPTDISHRIVDDRIARAEEIYEGNLERELDAEEEAKREAEDAAIMEATGMTPEEYDAFISDLEQRLAEQKGYRTSDEYFNQLAEEYDRTNERSAGGSQEDSTPKEQGQETEPSGAEAAGETSAEYVNAVTDKLAEITSKYNSLAPIEIVSLTSGNIPEEIAGDIEKLKEKKIPAAYNPVSKKIYIFAENLEEGKEELFFFHENLHRGLEQYYGNGLREIAEAYWDASTSPASEQNKSIIAESYADQPDKIKEEYLVSTLAKNMTTGHVDRLIDRLLPEHQEIINNILRNIGYDRAKEAAERTAEEGSHSGGTETEGLANNEERGTQRGVNDRAKEAEQRAAERAAEEVEESGLQDTETGARGIEDFDWDAKLAEMREKHPDATFIIHHGEKEGEGPWELRGQDAELVSSLIPTVEIDDKTIIIDDDDKLTEVIGTLVKNKHRAAIIDELKEKKESKLKITETVGETNGSEVQDFSARLATAKEETNTKPTEEQKKAGNYKMGHISFGGYRMSIENPKGSTRSGKDANGKAWSIEMQDTYGYIGKKYGTDGDHLDFFINDDADLDNWNGRVYVVDQKNEDGTFDEHKVMYGYPSFKAAKEAYSRNYDAGWWEKHVMQMTGVRKETFDKWLDDSDHKRKPFAEYSRTRNAETITDNVDQLLADVRERAMKNVRELHNVTATYKKGELEKRTIAELEQLKKKREKDASTARYLLKATNVEEGSEKEHVLKMGEAQAKADIKALDKVLEQKRAEAKSRIEQQEIGFAVADRLNEMGYDVETDPSEVRRVRKAAEKDKSEEGKLRHMKTYDGTVYGFVYRGRMYLDIRKIDGNLPLHEYAHPWCEAFRKMNPEGWKSVVQTMKGDKDTWEFVKQLNPDLKTEDDIAEEMIAKGTGEKGEQYAKAEYERMHGKDGDWKSKWNNIWKNIAKAIQDFWKQVGDYLKIKYETPEQVYDQVIRDFANNVNPKKKMERWLKERDKDYLEAVKTGDEAKAKELFDAALRENIGSGIVPFVSAGGYRGKMQHLAHGVKTRDPKVIAEVADLMVPIIPRDAVLVPAPSRTGEATDMLDLAKALSERTGAPVADVLKSEPRGSQYEAKYAGKPIASGEMGITLSGELPEGKLPVVIDNVVDTGNTAEACVRALGKGIVASLADSKGRYKRVATLKSAEPVVTDKKGQTIPLSKRFELPQFMIGDELDLFSDADFEDVEEDNLNQYGLDESTDLGKQLTELKKQAGPSGLVGYVADDAYVFVGESGKPVEQLGVKGIVKGEQDGMTTVSVPEALFDEIMPKLVKDGYRMALVDNTKIRPLKPKDAVDKMLNEVERRKQVAKVRAEKQADKTEAEKIIDDYLKEQKGDSEETRIRKRATKAILKLLKDNKVPFHLADETEEKKMLKIFSMFNKEAVKNFARKVSIRSNASHGHGRYCVYNMEDPFGVPMYAEKLSVAKEIQDFMNRTKGSNWEILDIGYKDEAVEMPEELKEAANFQAMMGWHGSGAKFEKFDHRYMGSGEGNQSYGWGTYITEVEGIGRMYAEAMGDRHKPATYKGLSYSAIRNLSPEDYSTVGITSEGGRVALYEIVASLNYGYGDPVAMLRVKRESLQEKIDNKIATLEEQQEELKDADGEKKEKLIASMKRRQERLESLQSQLAFVNSLDPKDFKGWSESDGSFLYKVDIPDDNGSNYFDWTENVPEERADKILSALEERLLADDNYGWNKNKASRARLKEELNRMRYFFGATFYGRMSVLLGNSVAGAERIGKRLASELLHDNGYVGIKYPAEYMTGGRKDGAKNYVIFDEKDAKITDTIQFMVEMQEEASNPIGEKEKTDAVTRATGQNALTSPSASVSGYKVKQLIHSTQENDQKLLGISEKDGLSFQAEKNGILGWSDSNGVTLTKKGLNPNTPIHECSHLWDNWCQKEQPELWKQIVAAMKTTPMWQQIRKNPNYRAIWNDDDKMASEVKSRLTGATSEEEFTKAAFKPGSSKEIINKVKSALKKFWESLLRLFGKTTKTISDEASSVEAIRRMTLRDLMNQDFEKVMKAVTESDETAAMRGEIIRKTLMGVHNLSEEKLRKVIKAGGLANPSLAVIDTDQGVHTAYGDISLIPRASLIDKKTGRNAGTYAGDAWTPTYPHVERSLTAKGEKRAAEIAKEVAGDDEEMARHIRSRINDYFEGNGDRMHFLFLKQKGLDPQIRKERIAHSQEEYDAITKIFGEPTSNMPNRESITKEQNDALVDLMVSVYEKKLRDGIDPEKPLTEKMQNYLDSRVEEYRKNLLDDDGYIWFAKGDNFIHDNWRDEKRRQNPQPDWYGTDNDASYQVAKEGLSEEYEKWKESLLTDDEVEEKLFAGYTPSGNRRYLPNTVENASRLMNKNADQNAYDQGGFGPTRAMLLQNFASLADIRRHKDLIQKDEKVEERTKELSDELFDIINQISDMQKISDNRFSNIDYAEARLQEAMGKKNPIRHLNKEYGYNIPEDGELASQLMNFMEDVKNLPAKYFETKFKRPVTLDEFEIAVVPEDTSADIVEALKNAGLDVRTYNNTGNEEQRKESRRIAVMDAVGMRDDILFHIETDDDEIERLEREPKEIGYRNVVMNPDGTLGSPMANRLGKKGAGRQATSMFEFGKWERSDENPHLADENGKINLIKPNGKPVEGVDYNPYIHIRPNKINRQFKEAWRRPELIYVETEYPKSELEGGYQAEKAAKAVGKHPWGSNGEELILSRWDKPVRMVPWEEVADDWEKEFKDRGVEFDIIPPALLPILAERGVEILPPHKGMGKACEEAYEAFKARQRQLEIVTKANPMLDDYHTGIRKLDDIKTFEEAYLEGKENAEEGGYDEYASYPDITNDMIEEARKTGRITIYSSKPIKDGVFVTPSMMNAKDYAGNGKVYSKEVPIEDVAWINLEEGQYAKGGDGVMRSKGNGKKILPSAEGLKKAEDFISESLKGNKVNKRFEIGLPVATQQMIRREMGHDYDSHDIYANGIVHSKKNHGDQGIKNTAKSIPLTDENFKLAPYVMTSPDRIVKGSMGPDGRESIRFEKNLSNGYVVVVEKEQRNSPDDMDTITMWAEKSVGGADARRNTSPVTNVQNVISDIDAAKIRKDAETAIQNDEKMRIQQQNSMKEAADNAAEQLGGVKVNYAAGDEIADETLKREDEDGTLGIYDPKNHEVTLLLNNIESVDEAVRTVYHEKLGHEGLVALLGSQSEVNKLGQFIFGSASKDIRKRILDKADEEGYEWTDPLRLSKAAQEVFGDIAADGPRTADEFSLWRKVKHYLIRLLKAMGIKVRGLLNDADLRYYVLKTGEALKRWNKMSEPERQDLSAQADSYDIMRSRGGKPRKRNTESMSQYLQRLREWERWKVAEDNARAAGDPMPDKEDIDRRWEQDFKRDLQQWKEDNGVSQDETGMGEFPKREYGESPQEYAMRVADYESKADTWKTAPKFLDYMERAQEEYRQAYADWKRRYDLHEEENVDMMVYEGTGGEGPLTWDEWNAESQMERDLGEAVGVELDSDGAKRHAKLAVIERRKNLESANAEDAIWVYDFIKKTDEVAERLNEANRANRANEPDGANEKVTGKMIREALPFIIEGTYWEEVLRDEDGRPIGVNDLSDQMPIKKGAEIDELVSHIKDWYDEFYHLLDEAGLRNDAGYIDNYVNHVWDKEKSDPKAWEKYIENYQRTKSPNMRHREIDTYQEGIDVGLVPKYKDIADMIAHYSRQNNEAIANKRFLQDLTGYVVEELNGDGEVVSILPLLKSEKPDALTRDRYAQYYVPGVGDVYVIKDVQKRFASVFGTIRTQDVSDWLQDLGKGYDLASSTMKKIQLSLSGFHMLALSEVALAQMRPDRAMKALFKYILWDSLRKGVLPAYAHPDDFKFAASHLVQLGATQDYAAADVNNITGKLRTMMQELYNSDSAVKKAVGTAGSVPAIMLDWVNKGMDKLLWNYLHDGLKIACFKMFAEQIEQRLDKIYGADGADGADGANGKSREEMREQLLDEAGQYVNDTFGGQYFELLNISPGMMKWLRRALLSPDWLISTQRHFMANFGFGSLYSDSSFRNYLKYNADNIKRAFGADIANDELRRFRSKNAKQCYILGVMFFYYTMMNALNALFRRKDEEEQQAIAEEERKTNPDYRSPYELVYPDGMKWYDYTMLGNSLGQQTHLYVGRYEDGSETYVRWGKQFREFPELFIGRHGVEFPTPLIERMMGKANPMVSAVRDNLGSLGVWGFSNSKDIEEIQAKYGKEIGVLAMNAKHFLPFSVPTQAEKEFKAIDLVMPSQKGFTRYKTVDFFKTYILSGDMEGVIRTYNAATMNNIDAEACLKAVISNIKATQRKELSDGVTDLHGAIEKFDSADGVSEKTMWRKKMRQYLSGSEYKVFSRNDAIEQVNSFLNGEDMEKLTIKNQNYLMLQTSADVIGDWKLNALKTKASEYSDKIKEAKDSGDAERANALSTRYSSWLKIKKLTGSYEYKLNKLKGDLGSGNDEQVMEQIRQLRQQTQEAIDNLESPK